MGPYECGWSGWPFYLVSGYASRRTSTGSRIEQYDSATNRLIIFGGLGASGSTNDTWILINANGLGGTPTWTQLNLTGMLPLPRSSPNVAYDSGSNRMVIAGGELDSGTFATDLWVLTNANGVVGSGLQITQILPDHGGNAGIVTAQIIGSGFVPGVQVKLSGSGPDILGASVKVTGSTTLTAMFDLSGATTGIRNVVVTNPDATADTLANAFTIEQGGAPQIWVDVVGRNQIRIGEQQIYYIAFGNSGNLDAALVPLWVQVPNSVEISAAFSFSLDSVISSADPAQYEVSIGNSTVIPIMLPIVPAGSSFVLPFKLAVSSALAPFNYQAWVTLPWITNLSALAATGDPDAIKCVSDIIATGFNILAPELEVGFALSNYAIANVGSVDQFQAGKDFIIAVAENFGASGTLFDLLKGANTAWGLVSLVSDCARISQQSSQSSLTTSPASALDPNVKAGPQGVGPQQYVTWQQPLRYSVFFENEPTATLPAQQVVITDQLDSTSLDLTRVVLGPVAVGSAIVTPTSAPLSITPFTTTLDLRPAIDILVKITASLNTSIGVITWRFQSLDPQTGLPPTNPLVGFLPPGGDASVFYTVMPKSTLITGTVINNTATVVFDANPPINTATWSNTIDNTKPVSKVSLLPATETTYSFPVSWSGTDVGAGIRDFTIYVSDNSGAFTAWLTNTTEIQGTYDGVGGHTYGFYSIARDLVGNSENAKTAAEATTRIVVDTTPPVIVPHISGTLGNNGWYRSNVTVSWSVGDPESGIASSSGCSTTNLTADTSGITITCSATNGAGLSSSVPVTTRIDTTPPVISGMPATGCSLWPPDHRLVQVAIVTAADALSGLAPGSFNVTGTSNELTEDLQIVITPNGSGGLIVQLQADRLGTGTGRVYTLTAAATDLAGNPATATATCTVPHDQGN